MSNRATRRALRAKAREAAEHAAARTYDYTPEGALVRVTDPRAVAVLRRAYEAMLRRGRPITTEISEREARGFPRWRDGQAGMVHVLAAWIDPAGRGCYALRSAVARDLATGALHRLASAEAAEGLAHAALAEITSYPGFPITHTGGRA